MEDKTSSSCFLLLDFYILTSGWQNDIVIIFGDTLNFHFHIFTSGGQIDVFFTISRGPAWTFLFWPLELIITSSLSLLRTQRVGSLSYFDFWRAKWYFFTILRDTAWTFSLYFNSGGQNDIFRIIFRDTALRFTLSFSLLGDEMMSSSAFLPPVNSTFSFCRTSEESLNFGRQIYLCWRSPRA